MLPFSELIQLEKPVLVDFFATWCGPCKMMSPILSDLKKRMGDSISIIKIDVDKNPATAASYQVQGVPALLLFKEGKLLWQQAGVVPAAQLEKIIRQYTSL
ncbi:thioredoxin [Taibaiella lutea]|uniref:Thioredoxin n=1 Tax=Taibaiella lutea TaxID=2608001 RepID=A0A5M6CDS3_9BACT|nr:thioredoxin [Taibaiella lutea]KAA5532610.1 thioredoxin [Taibaiella lutea]